MSPPELAAAVMNGTLTRERTGEAADALVGHLERGGPVPTRFLDLFEGKDVRETTLIYLRGIRAMAESL